MDTYVDEQMRYVRIKLPKEYQTLNIKDINTINAELIPTKTSHFIHNYKEGLFLVGFEFKDKCTDESLRESTYKSIRYIKKHLNKAK